MARLSPRWLTLVLKTVGIVTVTAFAASVMPQAWIISIAEALGFEPFPNSPLTFYLARNLSLLYGFIGLLVLWIAFNLRQYRSLVKPFAYATILFGLWQAIVDTQAAMPIWWTAFESVSTILGGIMIASLDHMTMADNVTMADNDSND
jgi:hypothetical protein